MSKKNYLLLLKCMVFAGCAVAIVGLVLKGKHERTICIVLATVFMFSAVIQLLVFTKNPKLFEDKKEFRDN